MDESGTGLYRRTRKCPGKPRRITTIHAELVFRGAYQKCAHTTNEISALSSELVFRDIPWQLIQRRRQAQRLPRRIGLTGALLDAVCSPVLWIPPAPICLCFSPPLLLAVRLATRALPLTYTRVRPKPSPTNGARSLPGLWHGDPSWSPRRIALGQCAGSFLESSGGSVLPSAEVSARRT
jgi:hypothetical protein